MKKDIILLVTHFIDSLVISRYDRLRTEADKEKYDVMLLINSDSQQDELPSPKAVYARDELYSMGYTPICATVSPGSCHFALLAFHRDFPEYRNYWFVEYDVLYTGRWADFLASFEDDRSDFISCEVERYDPEVNGDWPWWRLSNNSGYPLERNLRGFNPICRYSNRALHYLDSYLKEGHSAHSEVMVTTALFNAGFTLADIGAYGEFSADSRKGRHYIRNDRLNQGSVRWRPEFTSRDTLLPNMLYHPVKTIINHNIINNPT